MDCKRALEEAGGDIDKAVASCARRASRRQKKAGRDAREGLVSSYIHPGGRLGVLIEVNCETDFVARTDEFQKLVRDLAMQVAGLAPTYVDADEIPADVLEARKAELLGRSGDAGKPAEVREKISRASSRSGTRTSASWTSRSVTRSAAVRDLVTEKIATIGENIRVRRFTRYALGEDCDGRGRRRDQDGGPAAALRGSARYRRILLKLSGEALLGERQYGVDPSSARSSRSRSLRSIRPASRSASSSAAATSSARRN